MGSTFGFEDIRSPMVKDGKLELLKAIGQELQAKKVMAVANQNSQELYKLSQEIIQVERQIQELAFPTTGPRRRSQK
jgi:hypothetical protein